MTPKLLPVRPGLHSTDVGLLGVCHCHPLWEYSHVFLGHVAPLFTWQKTKKQKLVTDVHHQDVLQQYCDDSCWPIKFQYSDSHMNVTYPKGFHIVIFVPTVLPVKIRDEVEVKRSRLVVKVGGFIFLLPLQTRYWAMPSYGALATIQGKVSLRRRWSHTSRRVQGQVK